MKLEKNEELFCCLYRRFADGKRAALLAGFPEREAEREAARLLSQGRIRRRIRQLEKTAGPGRGDVAAELYRLAFGPVNDAVRLAVRGGSLSDRALARLDLSALAELKVGEKGIEMKFFGREKAFALLRDLLDGETGEKRSSFYEALEKSVGALTRKEAEDR